MADEKVGEALSLAEVRLITRLRRGEPGALDDLWANWGGAVWSVCLAMAGDRDRAFELLQVVHQELPVAVRGWRSTCGVGCQLGAHVYGAIATNLELPGLAGITPTFPEEAAAPRPDQIPQLVASLPASVRLVYLVDLFFRCPAATFSDLVLVAEQDYRVARAAAAWAMVGGRTR